MFGIKLVLYSVIYINIILHYFSMKNLYLGIDGGGTHCRARIIDEQGNLIGEAQGGCANTTIGINKVYDEIIFVVKTIITKAGLPHDIIKNINAGFGLAGLVDNIEIEKVVSYPHPFKSVIACSDAIAACYGAHNGNDGGIAIFGTGSIGCAIHQNKLISCGGWGFILGDQGSGAQLGLQTLRQTMRACDKLLEHTPLTKHILEHFDNTPTNIVRWVIGAKPKDFGEFAKITCQHADRAEPDAIKLLQASAKNAESLINSLINQGVRRISLLGGLSSSLLPYLPEQLHSYLFVPQGDAMTGAIYLVKNPTKLDELVI